MYRQAAVDNQGMKWHGRALLLPGVPLWLVVALSVFFVFIFTAFILTGTYSRRVNVTGEVTTYPHSSHVYSNVQGVVLKKFVTEGQALKVGDAIYLIDVSKSTRSGVISDNQKRDIDNQIKRLSEILAILEKDKKDTLDMLRKQKEQYAITLARTDKFIGQAQAGVRAMKTNVDNYRHYQSRGLVTRDQLTNQIVLYYDRQNDMLNFLAQRDQNALQVTTLESQIQTKAAEFDNQIQQIELQRYELKKERVNKDAEGEIVIRALAAGRVDSMSLTVGQMVNPGDSLLKITPRHIDHYSLVIWVPNDALPYLSTGDRVNIRYEAFPVEKFGFFGGTISLISRTPASPQEMLTYQDASRAAMPSAIPYYKVIIRPDKQAIAYDSKQMSLENGMKAESTLFLEKRKIYQWMFSPIYEMKNSANGPIDE